MTDHKTGDHRDLRQEIELIDDAEICQLLGISAWTLAEWRKSLGFPRPVFITDGSPARTPAARIARWLDGRERRKRRPIRRGQLKRGDRLVDVGEKDGKDG